MNLRSHFTYWSECRRKQVSAILSNSTPQILTSNSAGGGFPGWLTNNPAKARTNETGFLDAWTPYMDAVSEFIKPYQVRVLPGSVL